LKVPKYISTLAISSFKLQIKLGESFLKKEILYKKIKVLNYIKFLYKVEFRYIDKASF